MSPLCLICSTLDRPRAAEPDLNICFRCHGRILGRLTDLELWVPTLDPTPQVRGGARRAPGYASRPPLNLDVVAALDDRTMPTEEDPNRAIGASVHAIVTWAREQLRFHGPWQPGRCLADLAWLREHLVLVAGLDDIAEIDQDLRELHDQVRRLAGEQQPESFARCINTIDLGATTHACRGTDHRRDWTDDAGEHRTSAQCGDCRRIYTGLDLVRLMQAQIPTTERRTS